MDFLYLSEPDMKRAGVENMHGCIDAMQDVFSLMENGDYRMGGSSNNDHGIMMKYPATTNIERMPVDGPDRRVVAMPAYLGGNYHMCGIKTYGSDPENHKRELPRSILMLILMDPETGLPLAYMSANALSAMRTGAVPGLGVRWLAPKVVHTISVIGPGVMGRTTCMSFIAEHPEIETIKIKGRGQNGIDSFIKFGKGKFTNVKEYVICDSIQEACNDSDIICAGTTNAKVFEDNPTINGEWIKPGALVIALSALIMNDEFLSDTQKCRLVVDNYKMYEGWGKGKEYPTQKNVSTLIGMKFYDLVISGKITVDDIDSIGNIINGKTPGRIDDSRVTVFAVGGMPTEDIAWGMKCYENAKRLGIGESLVLWDKPEFL